MTKIKKISRGAGRPPEGRMRAQVRLTPKTWDRITKLAADNGRTAVEELEHRLERDLADDRLAELAAQISRLNLLVHQVLEDRSSLVHQMLEDRRSLFRVIENLSETRSPKAAETSSNG
jgi:hypothetical protein